MNFGITFDFLDSFYRFLMRLTFIDLRIFLFLICTVFTFVIAIVLFFHWRKYGLGEKIFSLAEVVFLAVSVGLLLVAWFNIN